MNHLAVQISALVRSMNSMIVSFRRSKHSLSNRRSDHRKDLKLSRMLRSSKRRHLTGVKKELKKHLAVSRAMALRTGSRLTILTLTS